MQADGQMKQLVSCLVHACQLVCVNHSYGQTLGIFPGGCLLTSLCRREGERGDVDVLFAGLLTLKKQRICEEKMMNISMLRRLRWVVSKERNKDGFQELLCLQM